MKKFLVIGTGDSTLNELDTTLNNIPDDVITIGMHRVLPYVTDRCSLKLNYWTWSDPDAAVEGLRIYMSKSEMELKSMPDIVIPYYLGNLKLFKIHCGTSPLVNNPNRDSDRKFYNDSLEFLSKVGKIVWIENAVNTKSIPTDDDLYSNPAIRFSGEKTYFGSVPFDGVGSGFDWAKENKFTAFILPIVQSLGATHVFCLGYDNYGRGIGRTFDFAYNDMYVIKSYLSKYLNWVCHWVEYHKMDIYSVAKDEFTPSNLVMRYLPISEIGNVNTETPIPFKFEGNLESLLRNYMSK